MMKTKTTPVKLNKLRTCMVILVTLMALIFQACEKEESIIEYKITKAISGFDVNYRNGDGELIKANIPTSSGEDIWNYSFSAYQGDIVFVSARYRDINSAIKVQVLIDGKVFKEGSSTNDTVKYVTVSGTVPF